MHGLWSLRTSSEFLFITLRPSKMPQQPADSPFLKKQPVRLKFSILVMLLFMVVGAGVAMLFYLALRVPAFSSEARAYLGLTEIPTEPEFARRAHIIFVISLYTAPLGLAMVVYLLHHAVNWFSRISEPGPEPEEFRMD